MGKKLKLTENQLQMIMEYTMRNEMERHQDDWLTQYYDEDEPDMTDSKIVEGPFVMVNYVKDHEFLLKNQETNEYLYSIADGFSGDVYETMKDYMSYASNNEYWKDDVNYDELAKAVTSYTNDNYNNQSLKITNDPNAYINDGSGQYEYLLLTPEIIDNPDGVILTPSILNAVN